MTTAPQTFLFRSDSFNAGRPFRAEGFGEAASKIANALARKKGGKRACSWTLRLEYTNVATGSRQYSSTAGIPTKQAGECRCVGDSWFTVSRIDD